MKHLGTLLMMVGAAFVTPGLAQEAKVDRTKVRAIISGTFRGASEEWQKRIEPDETQRVCSEHKNQPPATLAGQIISRETAAIIYPADGNVLGDWKIGEKLAQRGTGGQFSDTATTPRGGNCYACHQLDTRELSYGTIGPSLTAYGKARKYRPEFAKAAYAKIYNAQASQPCSNMPRFGHNKFLTETEMKDLTAYLFDPESPVNK